MDKKFLAFEAKYKISDVIFKQHMETQFKLNKDVKNNNFNDDNINMI